MLFGAISIATKKAPNAIKKVTYSKASDPKVLDTVKDQ
jgi:hypothetical protein